MTRKATLLTLCLAVLVAQFDTAVANLGTDAIARYFSTGTATLQWVVDGYNLSYAALLLTGGLLADLYGRRLVFVSGLGVFVAGSLACALAPSIAILVAGRAVAGFGAALMMPASLAILRVVWSDERERGRALGVWTACNGVALAIGPTTGGLMIDWFGWRSIFLLVVPFCLVAIVLAAAHISESSDPRDRQFDAPGQLSGGLALGAFVFAAIELDRSKTASAVALVVAVAASLLFLRVEARRAGAALVPLDLFRSAQLRGASAGMAGMTFGMFGAIFLLPLQLQQGSRLSVVEAGIALMPMAAAFVAVSPFSGRLTEKWGMRGAIAAGLLVIGAGLLLMAAAATGNALPQIEIGLALTGVGLGFASGPLTGAAVGAVPANRAGTASALLNVMRIAGAALGVAVLGTVYTLAGGDSVGLAVALGLGALVQFAGVSLVARLIASPPGVQSNAW